MLTINDVVARVLLQNTARHIQAPIRQRCIDAINEILSEAMPFGHDRIAEGHDMAAQLDAIELAAYQALGLEPPTELLPKPSLDELVDAAVRAKLAEQAQAKKVSN